MFRRKVYDELMDWKNNYAPKYAALLEGARRVIEDTGGNQARGSFG